MSAPEPEPVAQPATQPAKAIIGGVLAALGTVTRDLATGQPWWQVLADAIVQGLVVGGVVHVVPNHPKRP